ncbi:MAG: hypothetical protein IPQ09_07180 [Myxococcales bacterium]|nr:hypothetical protein [Myxococcales bacterium]
MNNSTPSLALLVSLSNDTLSTTIDDRRPDALAIFAPLPDAQRASLAEDAWVVGLRAVMNAHRAAEESRLQDIGKALLDDVDVELREHVRVQQEAMVRELQRYFDPKDGQVVTRIDGFLKDGGELSRSMEKFLGPEHGVLATTLARALGDQSPLLRRLSPTDSEGVVSLIEARVREALEMNRTAVAKALDPLVPNGAVARFLGSLKQDLEKADGERTKQLALATKALDANDETSLLSRLVRETQKARATVLETMNPESPGSPLAMLKTSLTVMLETHAKSQAEVMDGINERQKEVRARHARRGHASGRAQARRRQLTPRGPAFRGPGVPLHAQRARRSPGVRGGHGQHDRRSLGLQGRRPGGAVSPGKCLRRLERRHRGEARRQLHDGEGPRGARARKEQPQRAGRRVRVGEERGALGVRPVLPLRKRRGGGLGRERRGHRRVPAGRALSGARVSPHGTSGGTTRATSRRSPTWSTRSSAS